MLGKVVLKSDIPALVIILALLQGCSSAPEQPAGAQTYFRGLVRAGDNQLQLRRCEQRLWQSAGAIDEDLRERIIERLATAPLGTAIYLEAWGEPQQPIQELQMLGGDISTCQHQLEGIRLRAGGLNPVWYADVKTDVLEVHDSTRLKSWRLSGPEFERSGDRWSWQGERARLSIEREQCVDALGVEYALSAQFSAGTTQLSGCARYGDLQRVLLKSHYYSRDPSRQRQLGLRLMNTDRFDLSLITPQGERDSYAGQWRLLSGGQLLLQLEDDRLRGESRSLRFKPEGGGFALVSPHPLFGSELLLYPGVEPLLSQQRLSGSLP